MRRLRVGFFFKRTPDRGFAATDCTTVNGYPCGEILPEKRQQTGAQGIATKAGTGRFLIFLSR
jgi:hypothetical protein